MAGFNKGTSPNAVKTALDLVFMSQYEYKNIPSLATAVSGIFNQETTSKNAEVTEQFQGVGYFDTRAEQQDVPEGSGKIGNQKTFTVLNYDKSIHISKNFFDDDQHSVISKMMKDAGRTARLTKDKVSLNQFNLGFTTALTNDGVALFSNSHVTLNGTTVDNLSTGALSESTLYTLIQLLINQKTQDGTLGGFIPTYLLVPSGLDKTAREVTKSTLRSGTGNNDLNYYSEVYPGMQVLQSPFLEAAQGGSATAHFVLSENHSMTRWVRQDLQTRLVDWETQANNDYIYKVGYREVTGAISYEGMVGSTGV